MHNANGISDELNKTWHPKKVVYGCNHVKNKEVSL